MVFGLSAHWQPSIIAVRHHGGNPICPVGFIRFVSGDFHSEAATAECRILDLHAAQERLTEADGL